MGPTADRVRRRVALALAFVGAAGLLVVSLLGGCSPRRTLVPKLAPETTVFVQGPVDTVDYRVHLYWFGTDADGYVVNYELRFKNPDAPADTQWIQTTRTDSTFRVYTPHGVSMPAFEVRAVDNDGLTDPTPARQVFSFRNEPPNMSLVTAPSPSDVTFASVTLTWTGTDPDGDDSRLQFRVWLDGHRDEVIVTGRSFTVPTSWFRENDGSLVTRDRTVYVQAIDEGGFAADSVSATWHVRAPVTGSRARLLLIDDVSDANGTTWDTLYTNTAARNLTPDEYTILKLESTQPFHSALDIEQTFKLFEAVVWYRGPEAAVSLPLQSYRDGLAAYLEATAVGEGAPSTHAGRFFIESLSLIEGTGASGALPEDWLGRYLGSDFLYKHETNVPGDSSVAWDITSSKRIDDVDYPVIVRGGKFLPDSLRQIAGYSQLRGFAIRDTDNVALWARSNNLSPDHDYDIPIGVSVPQPSGGRLIAITTPLRAAHGEFEPSFEGNAHRYLAKIFQQLGLTNPEVP